MNKRITNYTSSDLFQLLDRVCAKINDLLKLYANKKEPK